MGRWGWQRIRAALLIGLALLGAPASAEVRVTFWSRDSGSYFPHAFITLKGTVDSTGEVVDTSFGYTVDDLSPLALFASVPSHIDITNKSYMRDSDAHFQVRVTDEQYAAIRAQVAEWGARGSKWNLNRRNCVHFAAEAARRAGLVVVEDKHLMKKPKSFTRSLIALNPDRVTVIDMSGRDYWAKYPQDESFGVPADNRASVLERRISRRATEQAR